MSRRRIGFAIIGASAVLAALLAIALGRAIWHSSQLSYTPQPVAYEPDINKLAQTLGAAVRLRTISFGADKPTQGEAFLALHRLLETAFPRVHAQLTREIVNRYSLLYHWPGRNPGDKLPVLLLAHSDVVPISPGTRKDWDAPPFAGVIRNGFVWGRGTLDNKQNIITSLQAIEDMLAQGVQPERDIYLAFGHDEEQSGFQGAGEIAKRLKARDIRFAFVLDEGGAITQNVVPGTKNPIAIIGPAEKGYVTLRLTTKQAGGHSSTPPKQSAIGILAAAFARLEANPFPKDFSQTNAFLSAAADDMPLHFRFVMKNGWLFGPLISVFMQQSDIVRAGMHTTTAITMVNAGIKENVLPTSASGLVNFRIYSGETPDSVMARVRDVINDDRVMIEPAAPGGPPSSVAPISGFAWETLNKAILDVAHPQPVTIAPRILVAATDTRRYTEVSDTFYRFAWMNLDSTGLARIHGTNERIALEDLRNGARFYYRLLNAL